MINLHCLLLPTCLCWTPSMVPSHRDERFQMATFYYQNETRTEMSAWTFSCSDSLRTSQNSLVCDSDFPSPVNHLLSKLTKVILYYTSSFSFHSQSKTCKISHCFSQPDTPPVWKTHPHLSDVFISAAAHEISICVLSGCWHVSTNQRLNPCHVNFVHYHKVAPPICLLWQQPQRQQPELREWHAHHQDPDGPARWKPVSEHPGEEAGPHLQTPHHSISHQS